MVFPIIQAAFLKFNGTAFARTPSYLTKALQSVLNECSSIEIDVGFSNREQLSWIKTEHRRKKSWQTIVRKIRAVSRVVNRHRDVKEIKVVKKTEAVKVNRRADSKAARVVSAVNCEEHRARRHTLG